MSQETPLVRVEESPAFLVWGCDVNSLALHYIERFDHVCRQAQRCLTAGGSFVFSVEHPIFTALAAQDWHYGPHGARLHWPVDHYLEEGQRQAQFLEHVVVKYHRAVATYVNALLDADFMLTRLVEPQPTPELMAKYPDWADETRRPMFLLIAAEKRYQGRNSVARSAHLADNI